MLLDCALIEVCVVIRSNTIYINHNVTKHTFWHVRPMMTQISLCVRAASSESSLPAWRKFASLTIQNASSEDSDQTAWMRRQIWIFAGHTCQKLRFLTLLLKCQCQNAIYPEIWYNPYPVATATSKQKTTLWHMWSVLSLRSAWTSAESDQGMHPLLTECLRFNHYGSDKCRLIRLHIFTGRFVCTLVTYAIRWFSIWRGTNTVPFVHYQLFNFLSHEHYKKIQNKYFQHHEP